ncbi:MAG: peptide ABC transporter permease [Bacillota bacterium]|nr:MAG: peptide ABC transporter permease [Bacillota bacterium]
MAYAAQRLLVTLLTLWAIATLTFFMMHAVPGGPFDAEKDLPPAVRANLEARYHLDWPLWRQYLDYLRRLAIWDLGPSFTYPNRTVNDIVAEGFRVSAALGALAIATALVAGVGIGVLAALRHGNWPDRLAMLGATLGVSVPNFILSGLLIYVFAYRLRWLPAGLWGKPAQAVMPTLALAALPTAVIARLVRANMLEVLRQDFITVCHAKGLAPGRVVFVHALRNAILPVVTYLGPLAAGVLTGSFVVEQVFAIPGLGKYFVQSVTNRDYTVIMGVTMFYSVLLVVANVLVDLAYRAVDPRIRL